MKKFIILSYIVSLTALLSPSVEGALPQKDLSHIGETSRVPPPFLIPIYCPRCNKPWNMFGGGCTCMNPENVKIALDGWVKRREDAAAAKEAAAKAKAAAKAEKDAQKLAAQSK